MRRQKAREIFDEVNKYNSVIFISNLENSRLRAVRDQASC